MIPYTMSWFHADHPKMTLEQQLNQSETNSIFNIYELTSGDCFYIEKTYKIYTIGELVDYVMKNGFPRDVDFRDRAKMIISARVFKKFLGDF